MSAIVSIFQQKAPQLIVSGRWLFVTNYYRIITGQLSPAILQGDDDHRSQQKPADPLKAAAGPGVACFAFHVLPTKKAHSIPRRFCRQVPIMLLASTVTAGGSPTI